MALVAKRRQNSSIIGRLWSVLAQRHGMMRLIVVRLPPTKSAAWRVLCGEALLVETSTGSFDSYPRIMFFDSRVSLVVFFKSFPSLWKFHVDLRKVPGQPHATRDGDVPDLGRPGIICFDGAVAPSGTFVLYQKNLRLSMYI